jgi:sugar lactone lactonase YvrE
VNGARCLTAFSMAVCVSMSSAILAQQSEDAGETAARLTVRPAFMFNQHLYFGAFDRPRALACDRERGELWMADTGSGRVGIFRLDGTEIYSFQSRQVLRNVSRIALSPDGHLLVVEADRTKIRRFDYRGEYRGDVELPAVDHKRVIAAIAYDANGNLYVGDNATAEISVLTPQGRLKLRFGSRGRDEGQFMAFAAIAVAADGSIVVADQQALAVQRFDSQGNFIAGWGKHEMGKANFSLPSGLALDAQNRIYVSDELRHQVKVFSPEGELLAAFGGLGDGPGQLSFPTDVAVDGDGRVYVAERFTSRVQVFALSQ